jgi:hypothetical protein
MFLATDREEDLVQMPLIPTARATTAKFVGVVLSEFKHHPGKEAMLLLC